MATKKKAKGGDVRELLVELASNTAQGFADLKQFVAGVAIEVKGLRSDVDAIKTDMRDVRLTLREHTLALAEQRSFILALAKSADSDSIRDELASLRVRVEHLEARRGS